MVRGFLLRQGLHVTTNKRWFWIGPEGAAREAATALLGGPPATTTPRGAVAGDVVLVHTHAAGGALQEFAGGHAFAAVRALKDVKGVAVYVVVVAGDRIGAQMARFCLADGVLPFEPATGQLGRDEFGGAARGGRKVAVDSLLAKLEPQLAARGESSLQRLLQFEREDSLLTRLQDPETGLFDGPYATLKLDEEWKRAHRFHQPLSLLLIDLGLGDRGDAERRGMLAEASGVFLNECRDIDVLARFAPTIFLFLLPGTGQDGAEVLAKRILASLRARLASYGDVRPSCGICSVPSSEVPDRRAFLGLAEACLRRAEASGAGGVCTSWQ
jgi:GGDEF domain-containing protein